MSDPSLLNGLLEPLGECLDAESARRLLALRPSEDVEKRIAELAARANEGILTPQEYNDYEAIINTMDIIAVIRLKARQRLHMTA